MREITLTITDKDGVHARPASDLCKAIAKFDEKIELSYKNRTVNMKSTLAIMSLAIPKNSDITIKVTGDKEDSVLDTIVSLFKTLELTD
jgi:phosphocarrier protein